MSPHSRFVLDGQCLKTMSNTSHLSSSVTVKPVSLYLNASLICSRGSLSRLRSETQTVQTDQSCKRQKLMSFSHIVERLGPNCTASVWKAKEQYFITVHCYILVLFLIVVTGNLIPAAVVVITNAVILCKQKNFSCTVMCISPTLWTCYSLCIFTLIYTHLYLSIYI